jgi:hypothetical protein
MRVQTWISDQVRPATSSSAGSRACTAHGHCTSSCRAPDTRLKTTITISASHE